MIVSPDYRIGWTIARPGAAGKRYLVSVASKAIPLGFNLDFAVALSRKREAEPFRSEVNGLLPLSRDRSMVR
jgi:hypothetical protein